MKKLRILLLSLVLLTGCTLGTKDKLQQFQKSTITAGFDTTITIIGLTENEKEFDKFFEMAKEKYLYYHELYDIYNNYPNLNNLKTINDKAGVEAVEVDREIIDLLLLSKQYTELSDYFDITYGSVYKVWHDYREEGIELNTQGKPGFVPTQKELETAAITTGWDKVHIDVDKNTVYLSEKGVRLDVGAVAKGYATEKVAQYLEDEGLQYAIISGGGNIRTINSKGEEPWSVGIAMEGMSIDAFSLSESMAIVTSGDYQRTYYAEDGEYYSHLTNPQTLYPKNNFRSVSIVTRNSTFADILSTAVYMMDYDEALEFINAYNENNPEDTIGVFWIVDENPTWYRYETKVDGKTIQYDYMMTDNLKEISRNLNP